MKVADDMVKAVNIEIEKGEISLQKLRTLKKSIRQSFSFETPVRSTSRKTVSIPMVPNGKYKGLSIRDAVKTHMFTHSGKVSQIASGVFGINTPTSRTAVMNAIQWNRSALTREGKIWRMK